MHSRSSSQTTGMVIKASRQELIRMKDAIKVEQSEERFL